jgi:hypothetical protein
LLGVILDVVVNQNGCDWFSVKRACSEDADGVKKGINGPDGGSEISEKKQTKKCCISLGFCSNRGLERGKTYVA